MSNILEQSHPDMHLTSCISGVGVSHAANIKKRSPVGHATEAVKSFTKLTFYFLLDDVPTTPLLMSSHKAFLAKSTSNCSRSMVETVLMASTKTPSSLDLKFQKAVKLTLLAASQAETFCKHAADLEAKPL